MIAGRETLHASLTRRYERVQEALATTCPGWWRAMPQKLKKVLLVESLVDRQTLDVTSDEDDDDGEEPEDEDSPDESGE